jgi:hypothetical protein
MAKELEPPDLKRCQSEKPSDGPFMMGGEIGDPRNGYLVRCRQEPAVVATENQPGDDGQVGSMSLCNDCKKVFLKQLGKDYATFTKVEDYSGPVE